MSHNNSQSLKDTDTNLLVHMLANSEKLGSESKRWNYNGEKDPDLDDEHSKYLSKNSETDRRTDNNDRNTDTNNNTNTDNRTDTRNTETARSGTERTDKKEDSEENLTQEEKMLRKLDMLRKLSELAQAGVKLSQNYNMNSDYKMMKYEYELHKGIRSKQNGINWLSSMSLNLIYGIEMLNEKYNPFDLKLKGWSEQMNADVNNYYDVFGELYEKYNQPGKNMAPELKLLLMVSGSALKFHLTNTMMSNLPTLNSQLDEDPILAEQLRQKAIAQKIKEQSIKNNETLKAQMSKEHEQATQKAQDLNLIRQRELEYQNLKRQNAQQDEELQKLREKLVMSNTQQNAQTSLPNPVQMNQPQMQIPPMVQRMMMAKQQSTNLNREDTSPYEQHFGLAQNGVITNKITNLQAQSNYMDELEKIKKLRYEEERRLKELREKESRKIDLHNSSETSSESMKSSKSSVEYNVNIKNILENTKKQIKKSSDESSTSDKITSLGKVSKDEISMTSISLGKKRNKKDNQSKDSKETKDSEKPKNVRQKKTGISFE